MKTDNTQRLHLMERALLSVTSAFLALALYIAVQALGKIEGLHGIVQEHETRITVLEGTR